MKTARLSKMILTAVLIFSFVLCAFTPISFAAKVSSEDLAVIDCLRPHNKEEVYFILQLDSKYVSVSETPGISVSTTYRGETTVADIGRGDYIIEKKNMPVTGECFIVYIRHHAVNSVVWIDIAEDSFFDVEGNGNPGLSSFNDCSSQCLYYYKKYDGAYFNDTPVYRNVSFANGDKINLEINGIFGNEYKICLDDKDISTGRDVFDYTFTESGDKVFRVYYNDIIKDELPVHIEGRGETRVSLFKNSLGILSEAAGLLPFGILFAFNPLTFLPAGAVFGGILEGITGIFRAVFGLW